jgi:YidC/Oxa1 family membrane protein insertase
MTDQKNTILAIVLSALVLIGWQYFVGLPQMEKQKQEAHLKAQQTQQLQTQSPAGKSASGTPAAQPGAPSTPGQTAAAPTTQRSREAVIASSPRIMVETPRLHGSIAL